MSWSFVGIAQGLSRSDGSKTSTKRASSRAVVLSVTYLLNGDSAYRKQIIKGLWEFALSSVEGIHTIQFTGCTFAHGYYAHTRVGEVPSFSTWILSVCGPKSVAIKAIPLRPLEHPPCCWMLTSIPRPRYVNRPYFLGAMVVVARACPTPSAVSMKVYG